MKPIFHEGFKPIGSCYQQIKWTPCGTTASGSRTRHQTFVHGRSCQVGQAIVGARFNSTRTRSPQTCHNREHHRLGDDRFPDKCPGSSFTSACGAFRSSRNLNGVYRVSPISCTLPLSVPTLNWGPFPPPALPGFFGTTGLSATPKRPACPSRVSGWSSLTTPRGFPCCVRFPCVHAVATTPAQRLRLLFARFPPTVCISLLRRGRRIGLRNVLFEACSAFTYVTAYTLAGSPKATPYIGGFSYFVTSIAAPIAYGRSDLAGWDFHPLEKRRLITAHTPRRHWSQISEWQLSHGMRTVETREPADTTDVHKLYKINRDFTPSLASIVLNPFQWYVSISKTKQRSSHGKK
jgi:hypothetical protein